MFNPDKIKIFLSGLIIGTFLTSLYITQTLEYQKKEESLKKAKLVNILLDSQLTNQILVNHEIYQTKQNSKKKKEN